MERAKQGFESLEFVRLTVGRIHLNQHFNILRNCQKPDLHRKKGVTSTEIEVTPEIGPTK